MAEERKFGLGVFVCIFNKDFSKILFIKRNEEKRKKYGKEWGNVGGRVELGETSEEACIREAKEEIGVNLDRENLKMIKIIEAPNSPIYGIYHVIHFVYATSIPENTKIKINHESEGFQWFDMDNLPDKMLDKKEDILEFVRLAKKNRKE
jgi:ADP-ribose pyrophosphatase YjhB (NUDIX family)